MTALDIGEQNLAARDSSQNEAVVELLEDFQQPGTDLALLGHALKDRGDSPAQVVLDKNLKAQADRRAEETKYELNKIKTRVDETIAAFELNEQLLGDNKAAYFVPDLLELEKVIGDTIQKRKYQQQVMIFVVGFEEATEQKLKLLNQINDFFTVYINNIDEKDLKPTVAEFDLEEISTSVQEALATADLATQKLAEINQEIVTYVDKLHSGKTLTKSKKKLEKALMQAKDDIMGLTEKLMGAQAEIEDKEDQMTKLYKQIDFKNLETLKYKNVAENAMKKLEEIEDLKVEIQGRDEEIERLNRAVFDQQLSLEQMEQSKEKSYAILKGAHDESEQSIQKLQYKVQNLQLLVEDTKADLQKHHRSEVEELRQTHDEEVTQIKTELQQKIDNLESEALNDEKVWASDSDEETGRLSNYHSSSRYTPGRKSVRTSTRGDLSKTPKDQLSRQSMQVSPEKSIKPSPPDTPKVEKKGRKDDSDLSIPNTPKRLVQNKSSLEPVHEVPYQGKVPLEDEEKWTNVPAEKLPSAFTQYRKETLLVVQGLQNQLKVEEADHQKKVKQLRDHIQENDDLYKEDTSTLLKQVDSSMLLKEAAEKEADAALTRLASFVGEHGETARLAEPEKKDLKKLTPEQREKFLGKNVTTNEKKSSKKGKTTSKTSKEIRVKETDIESQHKNEESKENISNTQLPITEVIDQVRYRVGNPEDDQLADAYVTVLRLDKEAKECVNRGQQTSRPESEAHRALINKLMSTGKMKPPPSPDLSSTESQESVTNNKPDTMKSTPSSPVVKNTLPNPNQRKESKLLKQRKKRTIPHHQRAKQNQKFPNIEKKIITKTGDLEVEVVGTCGTDSVDGMSLSRDGAELDTRSGGTDNDRIEEEVIARHLEQILDSAQWSDPGDDGAEGDDEGDEDRPSSGISQSSLYEQFKAQLDQKKHETIETRSRATSMHGSLLNGQGDCESRVSSALTIASANMGLTNERGILIKRDIGTSPLLMSQESQGSRRSSISVYDHPIVLDYLKTYDHVKVFKDGLAQVFSEKDLTIASDRLLELKAVDFHKDESVSEQITVMTASVELFLKEVGLVVSDHLNQEPWATVSSLMTSRLNTGKSRLTTAPSLGVHGLAPPEDPNQLLAPSDHSPPSHHPLESPELNSLKKDLETDPIYLKLQEDYKRLKGDLDTQMQMYEGKLKDNALNVVDLEETIHELQQELTGLGTSVKPLSSVTQGSSRLEGETDATVIFSRMDTERNQKALKRGISSHKVTPDQYNEAVKSMEQYNAVPAKRLLHMVQKYSHHVHMKQIEENVKRSRCIDDEVFSLLEKMEALQNIRAERWGEQMDFLAEERMKLAHLLMASLIKIEEESGIFLIKPILSWKGRGYLPHFQSKLSTYQPPKTFLRPLPQDSVRYGPAPTPTPSQSKMRTNTRESGGGDASSLWNEHKSPASCDSPIPLYGSANHIMGTPHQVPLLGSAIQMVGTLPQAMWSMSSSLPATPPPPAKTTDEDGVRMLNKLSSSMITTPKILELEINRMLIGQNTVSSLTRPFLSDDRLVNAANASVRSYMTIARPSAYPIPSLRPTRPNSSGTDNSRIGAGSPLSRSSSSILHMRTKSESSLHPSEPLPPIKVPTQEKENEQDIDVTMNGSHHVESPADNIQCNRPRAVMHPSPPQTPPGSSIRQSPPALTSVDWDSLDREEDNMSANGHVTKMEIKSPTGIKNE